MSTVATRLSLTHLCTIERNANAATANGRGNPTSPNWQPSATNVACRYYTTGGRERAEAETTYVAEEMRLLVPVDTNVTERDRIGDITDRGTVIVGGPVGIRVVHHRRDFLELALVQIKP